MLEVHPPHQAAHSWKDFSLQEANGHQAFYGLMTLMGAQSLADWDAINDAHHFDLLNSDPTHLSAQQLNETIQLTEIALAKHIQFGDSSGRYAHEFPELPHTITWKKSGPSAKIGWNSRDDTGGERSA
jgi:hypothetical protein